MREKLLSICISSYNHMDSLRELVLDILSEDIKEIEVIIVDDNSAQNIFDIFQNIDDSRLIVIKNEENIGPLENWYKTISAGSGRYILHMLDRDKINKNYLHEIIRILSKENVDFGYIGNYGFGARYPHGLASKSYCIYEEKEAIREFALKPMHPSGFLISNQIWEGISKNMESLFNVSWGIYPHRYIYAELAGKYKGIYVDLNLIEIANQSIKSIKTVTSNFYSNEEIQIKHWEPKGILYESERLTEYAYKKWKCDDDIRMSIVADRVCENYMRVLDYGKRMLDINHCMHYGIAPRYICEHEVIDECEKYKKEYIQYASEFFSNNELLYIEARLNKLLDFDYKSNFERFLISSKIKELSYELLLESKMGCYKSDGISVAIYGYGRLGKMLCQVLEGQNYHVSYFIDKNAHRYRCEKYKVYSIGEAISPVDAIVVSLQSIYKEVFLELNKVYNIPIYSMFEFLKY